jgi:fibronectin type 3 domain-containing protein
VYTVTVTVTDDDGGAGSDTLTVTVESGQVPPEQTIFNLNARPKDGKVQLTWSPVAGASCYNVYCSETSGGPYISIAECHVTDYCTYLDYNVVNGTTYYYVVTSVADGVESLNSNEASATPTARTRR